MDVVTNITEIEMIMEITIIMIEIENATVIGPERGRIHAQDLDLVLDPIVDVLAAEVVAGLEVAVGLVVPAAVLDHLGQVPGQNPVVDLEQDPIDHDQNPVDQNLNRKS